RGRRALTFVLMAVGLAAAGIGILETFEAGRIFVVRSYVRAERAWEKYFPVPSARGEMRRLDPLLARLGLLHPVRVEVEPSVSLLLDPLDDVSRTVLVSRTSVWEPEVWQAISSGLGEGSVYV